MNAIEWARDAVESKRWLLFTLTGIGAVAGQAKALHEPGAWVSPVNLEAVTAHVIELDSGHTFVVDDGLPMRCLVLTETEVRFLLQAQKIVDMSIAELGTFGKATGVEPVRGLSVVCAVLDRARRSLAAS